MAKRALIRGGVAVAVSLALAAGAAPFMGSAAADPAGYDVVVPPVNKPVLAKNSVPLSGAGGYARVTDAGGDWLSYDGRVRTSPGVPTSADRLVLLPDGTERVISRTNLPGTSIGVTNPVSTVAASRRLPAGHTFRSAIGTATGWAVVTTTDTKDPATGAVTGQTVHLLGADGADGAAFTDLPVTGLPADALYVSAAVRGETATRIMVITAVAGQRQLDVVDLATGATVFTMPAPAAGVLVGNTHSFGWYAGGTARLYALDDPAAEPRTVALPADAHADTTDYDVTLTDSALLAVRKGSVWNDGRADPLYSVPLDGGPVTEPLPDAAAPAASEDGGAVVSGGTDADHWDTYRFAPESGTAARLFHNDVLSPYRHGISLARGHLNFMETMRTDTLGHVTKALYGQNEGTGAVPQPASAPGTGFPGALQPQVSCATPTYCRYGLVAGGESDGVTYVGHTSAGKDTVVSQSNAMFGGVPVDSTGGRIADASEWFTIYDSGSNGRQYVVDPGYQKVVLSRPIVAAALWGDLLSTATSTKGTLSQVDLQHRSSMGPVTLPALTTDAPCVIKEVQALGRWLYWSCGASGPAGVYDRTAKKSVRVPAGPALLGDGYILRHPGDQLQLTDARSGATRVLAALPADPALPGDDRGVSWTVDKFRGSIAYVAPDASIHLVPSGVAPSPLNAVFQLTDPELTPRWGYAWSGSWLLSGAYAGWKLEFRNYVTGKLLATSGGPAGSMEIDTSWNGKDAKGRYAPDGRYRWTLTATPSDGRGGAVTVTSGTFSLDGGTPNHHSYSPGIGGSVFGLTSAGTMKLYMGTGKGTFKSPVFAHSAWPASSTYLGFDDLDNDGRSDVLVRTSGGQLRLYGGDGEGTFAASDHYKVIGSGWNIYNSLLSPGDLTGDGRSDLLARTPGGDLYLYAADGKGAFTTRVRIGTGFSTFSALAGLGGDLIGDDVGALVARDRSGVLWRYDGDGKGRLKARVRLGSGWNTYNALVGTGDATADGRADLVARDGAGVLWRYSGVAGGGFAGRVRVGGGWGTYTRLF